LSSLLAVCALVALAGSGCATTNEAARSARNDPEYIEKLDNLSKTFESRDVEKLMGLYAQDTYSLSFDQQWAFDSGAADHRGLLLRLLSELESLKIEWAPDAEVDRTSERVWTTRHFTANAVSRSGKETTITGWHSAIWEKRGEAVVIAYEHVNLDPRTVERALPPPPVVVPVEAPAAVAETFPDVFFDYDKWNIRKDQLESIGIVLAWLEKYPETTMTIEGHCDERGSSGYNIRLGERRATSTKAWLVDKGIAAERLQTISFGKSRPFEEGRSQGAWQSNRRSHFVVTKGPLRAE
jgi:outer membrane protein OmpA-like peptidoglycan-associated protein